MKLLQINKYYPPVIGGIETVTKDIADGLRARGVDVTTLVCTKPPAPHTSEPSLVRAKTLFTLWRMPISLSFFTSFRKQASQTDIILLHHPFPLGFLAYLLFGCRKPMLVFYHSDIVRQRLVARLLASLFTRVLMRATTIITTSQRLADSSPLLAPFKKQTHILPLWVNDTALTITPERTAAAQKIRLNHSTPIILSVGRLVPYKGYDVLIRAMKQVSGHLIIVGDGPLQNELLLLANELGVSNRISFVGSVPDVVPYYLAADLFVLSSTQRSEAYGIVQLEAMHFGLPVVNTDLPTGVPEVSLHRETGLTVAPGDVPALAAALTSLIEDLPTRNRYAEAARARAHTRHLDTQIDSLLQLIQIV